jgi:hypothetical protein
MQIKTAPRFCLTPVRLVRIKKTNNKKGGKDVGGNVPSYTADGNINQCNHYRNQYGGSSKNENRSLLWPHLNGIHRYTITDPTYTPLHTHTHTHSLVYYSVINKNEIMIFARK